MAKTGGLDLSFLTNFVGETGSSTERLGQEVHSNGPQLDDIILADPEVQVGAAPCGCCVQRFLLLSSVAAAAAA